MSIMEVPPTAQSGRLGRRPIRRRSKAQRDRYRGPSPAISSSSRSPTPTSRPLRRRKRQRGGENVWIREEDLIDGFCISSYGSLEAMQRDTSVYSAQSEEVHARRPPGKRKRSHSEDPPASGLQDRASTPGDGLEYRDHKKRRRSCCVTDVLSQCVQQPDAARLPSQCDAERSCDEQVSSDDLAVSFTISACSDTLPLPGARIKLLVLSQVSGLERSCEKNQDLETKPPLVVPMQSQQSPANPHTPCPPTLAVHSIYPKQQPVSTATPEPATNSTRSSLSKSVSGPQMSPHPPTPSLSGHCTALRPPSQHQLGMFTQTPGLPPPPPLLQVTGHPASVVTDLLSEHGVISPDVASRFMSVPGAETELGTSVRPMFQFHQHNHQHMHHHTHQHFTPYPPTGGPGTFEKYPGKQENLYRQNFFAPFSPVLSALPPDLPQSVSFGSMQGAFQPKSTSSTLASRCSVPSAISHKAPQLPEQFRQRKSGRWCAMHVRVAFMILRHQERLKLARGTPHKPELRSDLVSCMPTGLGSMSSPRDLARSPALLSGSLPSSTAHFQFSPAAASFTPRPGPVGSVMRTPGFSPLAVLTNGAFGGLGSPPYNPSHIFNHKEHPTVQTFPGPHDPWNRLLRTPPSFPSTPPQLCTKAGDLEKHNSPRLKGEKDRDLLYGHLQHRTSPLSPPKRLPRVDDHGLHSYVGVRPGSSSEMKPRLTPDHPSKVKVKEEPDVLTFELGRPALSRLHLPHPSTHFESQRSCFLGEQLPPTLEAWRDMYSRVEPSPLRLPSVPPHRFYEQREERAHILREDFEHARIYGLSAPTSRGQSGPSMLSALYRHPASTLLSKTPPLSLLRVPPPLISSHPHSPPAGI